MHAIKQLARAVALSIFILALWELVVLKSAVPSYILPSPASVIKTLFSRWQLLWQHGVITFVEVALGLLFGVIGGIILAISLQMSAFLRWWLLPLLVLSQAIPAFTLAPILVLWLGYGMTSKIAMASLIIFFPVTAALFDGLRQTEQGYLALASTMRASKAQILWQIRLPAALPALASGLRIGAAIAPIGAVVGEWVGASEGLGYLMMHSNARMQTEVTFAALFVLCVFTVLLYIGSDKLLAKLIHWN